ncbi:unnamed protein product [Symbiodinium necroappetens]|uniref:Uncharacterized protein n=1 Tax=Symbiodinium necroappetens TaxID=1628268 RepID=A0A812TST0_9DINO|nr:unnamed protein product [Symbiodinium necroappetens]
MFGTPDREEEDEAASEPEDDEAVDEGLEPSEGEASDAAVDANPSDVQADAAIDPSPSDVPDAAIDPSPLLEVPAAVVEVPAAVVLDPVEFAAQRSPAAVAEVVSSPEVAETKGFSAKEQLQERLRELKQRMALKREDTQLVPSDVLDQAAERLRALPSSEALSICSQTSFQCALHRGAQLASVSGALQPSHDKMLGVVAVEESVERSKLFRRPSASDLEVLRCNLADKFEALATEETCDSGPVKASRRELQELARPLAGSKTDSMLVAAELVGASAEPSVVSYKDSTLQPPQKDPALEPGTCLLSKRNSTPESERLRTQRLL